MKEHIRDYLAGQIKGLSTEVLSREHQSKAYITEKLSKIAKEFGLTVSQRIEVCHNCQHPAVDFMREQTDEDEYGELECPGCGSVETIEILEEVQK